MEAKAILRNARIAPRKVQIVLDLIRGKDYDVAMATVKHTPKAASEYLEKLLKSAAHNAENNHNMDKNNLYVAECYVCPGPIMKRLSCCRLIWEDLDPNLTATLDVSCHCDTGSFDLI